MTALRIEAPAKLNLRLRVVGRREDGFHLLEGDLVTLELADRLLLLPGCSGLRVDGDAAGVPVDESNLAWRGLVAGLREEPSLSCLALEKFIPAAAGLGGGSSDAASAWRLGRAARGVDGVATPDELAALAGIGADVPFFASGLPAAHVTGIGDRVTPTQVDETHVVLVHPPEGLSTADVFAELRPADWGTEGNDLAAPARRLRPELADLEAAVREAGGEPQLTGSGPTIFTLVGDAERAAVIAAALDASLRPAGVRVRVTRTRTDAPPVETLDEPPTDVIEERPP